MFFGRNFCFLLEQLIKSLKIRVMLPEIELEFSIWLQNYWRLLYYTVRKNYMARDGKYPHSTGKFTDTMHVKHQIEYFDF
jgi:hypothetical protein